MNSFLIECQIHAREEALERIAQYSQDSRMPLLTAPAAQQPARLRDLRLGRFKTDYGRGPKLVFVFNRARPMESLRLLEALRHPIKAWRYFHGWREGAEL